MDKLGYNESIGLCRLSCRKEEKRNKDGYYCKDFRGAWDSKRTTEAAVKLIDEDNTIPFIARYRKEVTGALGDKRCGICLNGWAICGI